MENLCACKSEKSFAECCGPLLEGKAKADTAVALMRSRYAAYVHAKIPYLIATTLPARRKKYAPKEIEDWAKSSTWLKLEIVDHSESIVEFKAFFLDERGIPKMHHERSNFLFTDNNWYFVDGTIVS
jgi:SEC-C motif-containing protein